MKIESLAPPADVPVIRFEFTDQEARDLQASLAEITGGQNGILYRIFVALDVYE